MKHIKASVVTWADAIMAGDIADPCIATSESKQMLSTLLLTNNLPSMVVLADVGMSAAFRNDHELERQRSNQNASLTTPRSNK